MHCVATKAISTITFQSLTVFSRRCRKNTSQSVPVVSGMKPPSSIELTLCFCFLRSTPSAICRWFNLFTSTCSHCCASLLTGLSFMNCSSLAFSLSTVSVLLLSNVAPLCFLFGFFVCFWFVFLKLHKGTRTHAQLPRRPVPPPKPRRSKKGVSRCGTRLSTSVFFFLSSAVLLFLPVSLDLMTLTLLLHTQ